MERLSKDKQVQKFLEEMMKTDNKKFIILESIRNVVYTNSEKTKERIMYGGIMFSAERDWGGVYVYKNHVSFEFSEGFKLNDPDNLLQGTGKKRRHLKLKSVSEISDKKVDFFVKQILHS